MWQGIYGHDAVVRQFGQSLANNRLASSYLFLGPPGVGKRTFAWKLAKALLCGGRADGATSRETAQPTSGQLIDPCDTCESCRLLEAGNHPDIDTARLPADKRVLPIKLFIGDRAHRNQEGLCHNLAMRPMLGERRVAIIDDADHLTPESSNCLLKTLEEPAPGATLILIGTSRARQLPTILSRTQIVRFSPLAPDVMRDLLIQTNIVTEPSGAARLAQRSGGSLERARTLADPQMSEFEERLLPQLAPSRFDSRHLVVEVTDFVNQGGKENNDRRRRLRHVFQVVGGHFRQTMYVSCGAPPPHGLAGIQATETCSPELALAAIDRCLDAEVELDRNANQATLVECWLDDLARIFMGSSPPSAN